MSRFRSSRSLGLALLLAGTAAPAMAADLKTLSGNNLVTFDSAAPGTPVRSQAIAGIGAGQSLLGIDARPASSRVLYGLSNTGQLYAINGNTAVATAVGTPSPVPAGAVGIDFNPTVDRIRVITTTGANYRVNPDTGALAGIDTPLAYVAADSDAGTAPTVGAVAYTNNVAGATSTTLYGLDTARGQLVRIGSLAGDAVVVSPNSGQLTSVGALGAAGPLSANAGFDIAANGEVLATTTSTAGTTSLYRVDLATGNATLLGQLGSAGGAYTGLAIAPAKIASYGSNGNQAALGAAFDNFTGVPSAGLNNAFTSLDNLAAADRGAALGQFTPASLALLPELTLRAAEFQEQTVRRYLRDFRAGGTGVEGAAGNARPGDRKFGSFVIGQGTTGSYDGNADRGKVDFGTQSVMGGLDLRLGARSLVGVYGGYSNMDTNLSANSPRSNIESWFGGGYGTLGLGPVYLDLFGSYGEASYDLRRGVRFGDVAATGTAFATDLSFGDNTRSRTWLGGGTFGMSFNLGGFEFEPFAGVRYANLKLQGIDEGTGFGALTLGRRSYESVLSNVGLRVGGAFEIGGATFRPEIRGGWRHEFLNDYRRDFQFGFDGLGAPASITYSPTPIGQDYATVGAGFTVSGPGSPLSLVVDYNGEFDRDRQVHGISGGLRLTF